MKHFKYSKLLAVMLIFTFMLQLFPSVSFAVGRDAYPQFDAEEIISQISAAESPADKEIVAEDTGKRSANEKHFKLEDGSYVIAQYVDAVHYEDENGEWVDIDNWQYVSQTLNMPTSTGETVVGVYSVTIGALYKGNTGAAYFDNIELTPAEN